jgi:hypothetical protein
MVKLLKAAEPKTSIQEVIDILEPAPGLPANTPF